MILFIFDCRCFGPKCGGCGEKIHYQDFVRKARDKVYHLRCFTCSLCSKQLSTGEVLYLQPGDEGFVCKDHYLNKGKNEFLEIICLLGILVVTMGFFEVNFSRRRVFNLTPRIEQFFTPSPYPRFGLFLLNSIFLLSILRNKRSRGDKRN